MVEMASRSLATSYPACVYSAPEMVWAVVQISSVYPSGLALETWRAPMLPEAPGRFFHHHVDAQALCKLLGDDAPHDISATACRERYNQRDLPVWPGRMNQAGSDQENTSEKQAEDSFHGLDSCGCGGEDACPVQIRADTPGCISRWIR